MHATPRKNGAFFLVDVVDNVDTVDDKLTGSHRGLPLQPRHALPLFKKKLARR